MWFSCRVPHSAIVCVTVGSLPKSISFRDGNLSRLLVLFFFTGRDCQSLYFVECIFPFKFTYNKELTLFQKFALQNALGSTLSDIRDFRLPYTWPKLVRLLPLLWSQPGSGGSLPYVGRPTPPHDHSEDAGVEWGLAAKVAEGSHCQLVGSKGLLPFWLVYPIT